MRRDRLGANVESNLDLRGSQMGEQKRQEGGKRTVGS